nr:hypothetical protein [Hallerella succinigenes]
MAHGGFVIRSGKTGWDKEFTNVIEYSLKLGSNPAFTTSVLVAYARALARMYKEGARGCKTACIPLRKERRRTPQGPSLIFEKCLQMKGPQLCCGSFLYCL